VADPANEPDVDERAYLEIWTHTASRVLALDGEGVTVGNDADNDVAFEADPTVSRMHAVLERYAAGWSIRDLGSRNGTYVNGTRIWQEQPLRHCDEVQIGAARLVYHSTRPRSPGTQDADQGAHPDLTRREREVLEQLCRPALSPEAFVQPASNRDIAAALGISEDAVRQHLRSLHDKFGIHAGDGPPRRVRLANAALERGAVTRARLRALAEGDEGRPP
jgi:DNA-binding CsgD family transcriptional regulator